MTELTLQAIFVPFVGILGNDVDRVLLICIGSIIWGGMSVGFGFARNLPQVRKSLCFSSSLYAFINPTQILLTLCQVRMRLCSAV